MSLSQSSHVPHRPLLGMGFAFMAYICFTVQDTLVSVLTHTYPPLQVTWMDMTVAWLLLTGVVLARKGWAGMKAVFHTHRIRLHMLRALFFTIGTGLSFSAVAHVPLPVFYVIIFVGPLLAVSFSGLFLKEPAGVEKFAAVLLGFAGLVVALRPGSSDFNAYGFLVLAAACMNGANGIINRLLARKDGALTLTYYPVTVLVILFSVPVAMAFHPMLTSDVLLAALAGLFVGMAMIFNANAYRFAPVYLIAPCQFLQFFWGSLAQYILYHRWPQQTSLIGAAMIIVSNLLVIVLQYRRTRIIQAPPPGLAP